MQEDEVKALKDGSVEEGVAMDDEDPTQESGRSATPSRRRRRRSSVAAGTFEAPKADKVCDDDVELAREAWVEEYENFVRLVQILGYSALSWTFWILHKLVYVAIALLFLLIVLHLHSMAAQHYSTHCTGYAIVTASPYCQATLYFTTATSKLFTSKIVTETIRFFTP